MVQGYLERTRSGLDDVLFASPAEVGASALNSCRPYKVPPHAFPCLLLAPLVLPIGTDAIPVLKPAPSRPLTLHTADPCAILAGLIRKERSSISSSAAAESSEHLHNHQQLGDEGRGDGLEGCSSLAHVVVRRCGRHDSSVAGFLHRNCSRLGTRWSF